MESFTSANWMKLQKQINNESVVLPTSRVTTYFKSTNFFIVLFSIVAINNDKADQQVTENSI